jgi:hypothetical protein
MLSCFGEEGERRGLWVFGYRYPAKSQVSIVAK